MDIPYVVPTRVVIARYGSSKLGAWHLILRATVTLYNCIVFGLQKKGRKKLYKDGYLDKRAGLAVVSE